MDKLSSRKPFAGQNRKPGLAVRESSSDRVRSTSICSRIGCSSKLSSFPDNRTGPDTANTMKYPLHVSRNVKESIGSSSRTPAAPIPRKASEPHKKLPFRQAANLEPNTLRSETKALGRVIRQHHTRDRLTSHPQTNMSRESTSSEASSSVSAPFSRHGKEAIRKGDRGSRTEASSSKYNLKNLKCNVLNDVDPSSSTSASVSSSCSSSLPSSSEFNLGRKKPTGRRKKEEIESSLPTRGKRISGMQIDERRNNDSHQGICISDSRRRNSSSTRNTSISREDASVMTGRTTGRARRTSMSREDARHPDMGMGGLAEMLLALDRIDQDDALSYEQLLILETNFFMRDLAFHDQHRDMRLDIDNMSYEQLLELEERMGTVSTALSKEALEKCVRKSIYETDNDEWTGTKEDGDIKCSICQEEYEDGNEVGKLKCDHKYHADCIEGWLQLKNWCPICKASVASPSENS